MIDTLGTVRTRMRSKLSDQDPAVYIWTDSELNQYIQDGYDLFCRTTDCLWDRQPIPDVAFQPVYDLPEGITKLDRVTWNDNRIYSDVQDNLTSLSPAFERQTGNVVMYLVDGDGYRKIRKVWPPATDDPTKFQVEYFRIGGELTSDTDEFEIPDWACRIVSYYALARAYERRGPGQILEMSQHYLLRWNEGLERMKERGYRFQTRRQLALGGSARVRITRGVPRPQLPWEYGVVVRSRRRR
jgi:hypothetical protein